MEKGPILLMVTSQDWGGAQAYVFNLAKEMISRGLPVKVCAGGKGELGNKCKEAQIPFIQLKHMGRNINPVGNLFSILELIRLFKRLKPSAVHLNSSMMGFVGSLAASRSKCPRVVYVAHGWVFNENLPSWKHKLYEFMERYSARWKDVIICIHPKDKEMAAELRIQPKDRVELIPNGIDIETFSRNLLDRFSARRLLGLQNQSMIIGTIANAYPPKNLLWYLDACKAAHEKNENLRFVIIGDGPQMEALKRKHKHLGLGEYVKLAGRMMDAPRFYKAFDLFVLPSSKEGMPITLLEAMAAGIPCIATDVGANRWMTGGTATIIPANDLNAVVNAINDLTADQSLRESLSQAAYANTKNRFSWRLTADETIKTFNCECVH